MLPPCDSGSDWITSILLAARQIPGSREQPGLFTEPELSVKLCISLWRAGTFPAFSLLVPQPRAPGSPFCCSPSPRSSNLALLLQLSHLPWDSSTGSFWPSPIHNHSSKTLGMSKYFKVFWKRKTSTKILLNPQQECKAHTQAKDPRIHTSFLV